jgi:hypothetical protein
MSSLLVAGLVAGLVSAQGQGVESSTPVPSPGAARVEVTLIPAAVQLNGKFTQHAGSFAAVSWRLRDRVGLQLLGGGNWYSNESSFDRELVDKFRVEAQLANSLLWTWGLFGGVELEPFVGSFTLFEGPHVRVGFVLDVGAGAGGTRVRLTPGHFGEAGTRFMATFSAGLRVQWGDHFTLRLGVRDVMYGARVDRVNGCTHDDLTRPFFGQGRASAECRTADFATPQDFQSAPSRVAISSSDVLHNVGLSAGAGFLF